MPKIFEYKFTLPPLVAFLWLYAANSNGAVELLQLSKDDPVLVVLSGVVGIFAVGFIFSTFAYASINFFRLTPEPKKELAYWRLIATEKEFTQKQILKAWDMFALNFIVLFAMTLVIIVVVWNDWKPACAWWIFAVLFTCLITWNTLSTWWRLEAIKEDIRNTNH
ncbi:hypothetical protein A3B35_00200 [Candidatus Kaiserbacteria bacterium RIFCSPLOWO2_01_FULL_54_24]|uniref:Uncharacterized protein n=1 Tax=Candidatus Kaiserbacteria bacterium RIFCSPLOWO2_01_FULL_54_24 TaxID=1798515 RepID=A0A1F6EV47_9BACT|nr:MAG: hypothetical protein A3B35_00200 [Candidatus Kaiserbacteria bacterium RIFCSPLOWO2_01_FULL_54_24]